MSFTQSIQKIRFVSECLVVEIFLNLGVLSRSTLNMRIGQRSEHGGVYFAYMGRRNPLTEPNFFLVKDIHDVITHAKFSDDRLRGSGVVAGQISAFPIDFAGRPYNTLTLPCERVISDLKRLNIRSNLLQVDHCKYQHIDGFRPVCETGKLCISKQIELNVVTGELGCA